MQNNTQPNTFLTMGAYIGADERKEGDRQMHCPFYDDTDQCCEIYSVEVRFLECARINFCRGKRYEACPVYLSVFLFNPVPVSGISS